MLPLFLFYVLIVLVLCIGAFFIVYHLLRYSLSEALGYFGSLFFGTIFILLLFINYVSFQTLEASNTLPTIELGPLAPRGITPTLPSSQSNPW